MRISELAESVGVATSTVRYYERVGLLGSPSRTASGYRDYSEDDAARLLFVTRARKMGLSCDQIADLLPVWDGANCGGARERVSQLIDAKQAEIIERIAELQRFAAQLDVVRASMETEAPEACRTDLSCCVPDAGSDSVPIALAPKRVDGVSRT